MEGWVGRTRPDSVELKRKSVSSHVARMTGGMLPRMKVDVDLINKMGKLMRFLLYIYLMAGNVTKINIVLFTPA